MGSNPVELRQHQRLPFFAESLPRIERGNEPRCDLRIGSIQLEHHVCHEGVTRSVGGMKSQLVLHPERACQRTDAIRIRPVVVRVAGQSHDLIDRIR